MILVDACASKVVDKMNASILPEMRLTRCEHKFKMYSNLVVAFMFVAPVTLSLLCSLLSLNNNTAQSWVEGVITVLVILVGIFLLFWQSVYDEARTELQGAEKHLQDAYDFFVSTAITMFKKVKDGDASFESLANACASGIVKSCQHRSGSNGFAVYIYEYDKNNRTVEMVAASQDEMVDTLMDNPLFLYGLFKPVFIDDPLIKDYYFTYCLRDSKKKYILSTWEDMLINYYWAGWNELDKNEYIENLDKEACRHADFFYNQYMAIPIINHKSGANGLIEIIAYYDAVIDAPQKIKKEFSQLSEAYRKMMRVVYEIAYIKEEVYQ